MASSTRRNSANSSTNRRQDWWSKFVPCNLSEDQKADCKRWKMDGDTLHETMCGLAKDGYKFVVKDDPSGPGFMIFMQPVAADHKYAGWILSGRGSDIWRAIKQALYKHYVVLEQEWPIDKEQMSSDDYND